MVLKKGQYYGFNGFQFSYIPRAPRSARGRRKRIEDGQACAFELLASLAGKLLQESESSSASSNASEANYQPSVGNNVIKHEQDEDKSFDRRSFGESPFMPNFATPNKDWKCLLKEPLHGESDSILEHSSIITNSDASEKVRCDVKSVSCKSLTHSKSLPIKLEGGSPHSREGCGGHAENGLGRQNAIDGLDTGGLNIDNTCSKKDLKKLCTKFPASINLDNNVKLPSRGNIVSSATWRHRKGVKLGIRDDDENFSRFDKQITKPKAFRPQSRIGDRRIRKLLSSKYWKVAPKLKDCEIPKVVLDGEMKSLYRKRKLCYSHDRYQHDTLYKRRKFSDRSLVVTSDGGFSSESVCNSPEKGLSGDKKESAALFQEANGLSASAIGHQTSLQDKDSHVNFSIKSFRIPELFIEVPQTTTVGSLKRTVMDAVTAILGGSLRIGVLLHGKKVRDDNRTLLQSGITSKENLDALGFILEPSHVQAPPPVCNENHPAPLQSDVPPIETRSPAAPVLDPVISDAAPDPPVISSGNNIETNYEPVWCHTDIVNDTTLTDSRALVPVPPVSAEALAVVPLNQKSKRSELVQRRARRPFSVSEVEALVQAVEELGTGRWRDVKLRSFENADHRTYVDLKDKWKTLVHTAKIAPQQRRGEPVPQELLDRVLAAHAYWSQHQAKQHGKNQASILKITEAPSSRNGAESSSIHPLVMM